MGITTTFLICYNLAILSFNKPYFSMFSHPLLHTLTSPGIATSIIIVSFFTLSTTTISPIMWSHCMMKSHRILKFLFSTTLSGSCSYKALPYGILAFQKTGNVHNFLHYHASVCTLFGQVCHIHLLYET